MYIHRKKGKKVVVSKKDTGEKVGVTTPGKLKGYLAALNIHAREADKGVEKEINKSRKKKLS